LRWLSPAAFRARDHLGGRDGGSDVRAGPGKARTGRALDNPVLRTEGRVTMIDGILAVAGLLSLALNAAPG
jgi:hypothetical protein